MKMLKFNQDVELAVEEIVVMVVDGAEDVINSIYEENQENQGNHFQDGALRMAKGIKWILE